MVSGRWMVTSGVGLRGEEGPNAPVAGVQHLSNCARVAG